MLGLALLAFIASCLSKAMAVPMAVALLLIDYWFDRKLSTRVVLEKVPFLLLALVFGWLAVSIQSKTAVADFGAITMPQRIAFAGYGFVMYWVKMFVPVNLVAFYPYPTLESNGQIAMWYFLMPVVAGAMIAVPMLLLRRSVEARKVFILGMGFFLLFVALVLQFLQVGNAIMADRYTYVPYIGSFFILAMASDWLVQRYGRMIGMGLAVVSLVLVPITYAQVDTWKNSESLWTNVMKHYPVRTEQSASGVRVVKRGVGLAYAARGDYFYEKGRFEEAFEDLKMAELAGHSGARYYLKLGVLYGQRGLREDALRALNIASIQGPNNAETLYNRGITLAMMDRSKEAVSDFEAILSLKAGPETRQSALYALAQETRSLGRVDESLSWCDKLISEFPQNADGRLVKALILLDRGQTATAAQLLSESVQLDSTNDAAWYRLAITRLNMGQKDQARTALAKARALGRQIDPSIEALVR
jgi:Flp pilus assembly protein TadD